jgi:Holliday junction DNA helicase RuvB
LKRFLDFWYAEGNYPLPSGVFVRLGLDEHGLTERDWSLIRILRDAGKPISLITWSSLSGIDENTIVTVHEPYLLQLGIVQKTPRGRVFSEGCALTAKGRLRVV